MSKVTSVELFEQLVRARLVDEKPDPHFFCVKKEFTPNAEVVAILALSQDYKEGNRLYDAVTGAVEYIESCVLTTSFNRLHKLKLFDSVEDMPYGS